MATKKKKDPLDLVRSKQATIASLPLCMDPEAFSDHGLAKQALDEAEGKLAGLRARQNALGDNAVDEEIASIEADLAGVATASQKRKMEARLATLKRRRSSSALARVEYDIEEQEKKAKAAQAEFDKTEKAVEEATVTFKMRAIPAKRQRQLMAEHKPTDEQIEAFEKEMEGENLPQGVISRGLQYNTDTYPPALIALCMVVPKMTEEEVEELIWGSDNWNEQEKAALFQLALQANQAVPLAR